MSGRLFRRMRGSFPVGYRQRFSQAHAYPARDCHQFGHPCKTVVVQDEIDILPVAIYIFYCGIHILRAFVRASAEDIDECDDPRLRGESQASFGFGRRESLLIVLRTVSLPESTANVSIAQPDARIFSGNRRSLNVGRAIELHRKGEPSFINSSQNDSMKGALIFIARSRKSTH